VYPIGQEEIADATGNKRHHLLDLVRLIIENFMILIGLLTRADALWCEIEVIRLVLYWNAADDSSLHAES